MWLKNVHSKENLKKTWQQNLEFKGDKTIFIKVYFWKMTFMVLEKLLILKKMPRVMMFT